MPQHKSAVKSIRQSEKHRQRNRAVRSEVRTAVRRFEEAPLAEKAAELCRAVSALDNAVRKGILKDQTASRKKSRLARALNALVAKNAAHS